MRRRVAMLSKYGLHSRALAACPDAVENEDGQWCCMVNAMASGTDHHAGGDGDAVELEAG